MSVRKQPCGRSFRVRPSTQSKSKAQGLPKKKICNQDVPSTCFKKIGDLPTDAAYLQNVIARHRYFSLTNGIAFAIADCTKSGQLISRYCLLEKLIFTSSLDDSKHVIMICSCDQGQEQKQRLAATSREISEEINRFLKREESCYCIHLRTAIKLADAEFDIHSLPSDESPDPFVDILSVSPFLAAVYDGTTCGLVSCTQAATMKFKCSHCTSHPSCDHISFLQDWCDRNNLSEDLFPQVMHSPQEPEAYRSISYLKIPYPLPDNLKEVHDSLESGKEQFLTHLIPTPTSDLCIHGNKWDNRDPVKLNWIASATVTIHKFSVSIQLPERKVYYRPTTGSCSCRLQYDGQDHLLFNLDNCNLFYYDFLFNYLHLMLEGHNPLAAYFRASRRSHASQSFTGGVGIATLRRAWNSFSRLLDLDFEKSFLCPVCGPAPNTVVCDGTMLGFRKDLLSKCSSPELPEAISDKPLLKGSKHSDRVLIQTSKARQLLLKFSGVSCDRKKLQNPKPLSPRDLTYLQRTLVKDGMKSLADIISRLSSEQQQNLSPDPYRMFLSELARNSPACGFLQLGSNLEVYETLHQLASTDLNIQDSACHHQLTLLQTHAPLLAEFICKCPTEEGKLPDDVRALISDILLKIDATFTGSGNSITHYLPIQPSPWSFFPALPVVRGAGNYDADRKSPPSDEDSCRKASYGHPHLTPGIFTIYCPHGVCYGFEVMRKCESPQHPFRIFTTRFPEPPKTIVYDNACKLHVYALNREPKLYKSSRFFVDRFHWRGHIGCSKGYCLDSYKSLDSAKINSQINEQANAGLQRIKGQLAYMKPENFMFTLSIFLAITNMDKIRKLDVSRLSISSCT